MRRRCAAERRKRFELPIPLLGIEPGVRRVEPGMRVGARARRRDEVRHGSRSHRVTPPAATSSSWSSARAKAAAIAELSVAPD